MQKLHLFTHSHQTKHLMIRIIHFGSTNKLFSKIKNIISL